VFEASHEIAGSAAREKISRQEVLPLKTKLVK